MNRRPALGFALAAVLACRTAPAAPSPVHADDDGDETEPGSEGVEAELPDVAPDAHRNAGGAALLAEAQRQLGAMRTSHYSHVTKVDEARGRFDYDCSGLIDYSLARVAPAALDELRAATVKRPLAKHFVQLFTAIAAGAHDGHWRRVVRVADLAPGDIVAWLKPDDVVTKNTGHVMIVRGAPSAVPGSPDQLAVPIVDSTSVRHGTTDSRAAKHRTGLGTGTIYLTIDHDGAPRGYVWSDGTHAHEHVTTIALGRIE